MKYPNQSIIALYYGISKLVDYCTLLWDIQTSRLLHTASHYGISKLVDYCSYTEQYHVCSRLITNNIDYCTNDLIYYGVFIYPNYCRLLHSTMFIVGYPNQSIIALYYRLLEISKLVDYCTLLWDIQTSRLLHSTMGYPNQSIIALYYEISKLVDYCTLLWDIQTSRLLHSTIIALYYGISKLVDYYTLLWDIQTSRLLHSTMKYPNQSIIAL